MGYVPPQLPVFLDGVMTINEIRAEHGLPVLFGELSPYVETTREAMNCRGCGFTHSDENCPYCGRGRA